MTRGPFSMFDWASRCRQLDIFPVILDTLGVVILPPIVQSAFKLASPSPEASLSTLHPIWIIIFIVSVAMYCYMLILDGFVCRMLILCSCGTCV